MWIYIAGVANDCFFFFFFLQRPEPVLFDIPKFIPLPSDNFLSNEFENNTFEIAVTNEFENYIFEVTVTSPSGKRVKCMDTILKIMFIFSI